MPQSAAPIGFIGLGVMGEPICRNLAHKSNRAIVAFDLNPEPLQRLARHGVTVARSPRAIVESCEVVFLSLPSGDVVRRVLDDGELIDAARAGQIIVDLGTSPVDLTRRLSQDWQHRGASFVDAPVARTRAAAEAGTLAVMVGAPAETFRAIEPLLATFASDITLCGPPGCGQVVKILNNMVLFEIGAALAEAKAIGAHAGVPADILFDALSKGSADSFALRNHGMKAILPDIYPQNAFSVAYARKDLGYALELASSAGVAATGARYVDALFAAATAAGFDGLYWPVISRLVSQPLKQP